MTHYHNNSRNSGFTLVELILAMLFISALLLAIGGLVIQVGAVFTKGITMRAVNESGQLIASDMQRTFNSSASNTFEKREDIDKGGRACIGNYVYAWNFKGKDFNRYVDGSSKPIRLVKFKGSSAKYCPVVGPIPNTANVPADASDLLSSNESNLFIRQLSINGVAVNDDAKQKIFTISATIGTSESLIKSIGCAEPESNVDDQYCGINTFTFTARAGSAL